MRSTTLALAFCALLPCAAIAQPTIASQSVEIPTDGGVIEETEVIDTTTRFRFDIPARPIRDALGMFSRQSGIRIELDDPLRAVHAHAVAGTLTAQQALRILLEGSGYWAWFKSSELVVITDTPPPSVANGAYELDPVVVSADAIRRSRYTASRSSTATKTDQLLRDVPQSITVLGRDLMNDQAMQSMADVVRYIPGITMGQGEGHRDAPTIRGNSSTADFFVDGVRDDAQYLRDLYNVERIEALKGSNAMIFGRGGGGGVINRVTKNAGWAPTRMLTFEGGSFDHKRATVDVGDGLSHNFAGRFNGMFERSQQFRDASELERLGVNPTASILAGGAVIQLGYEFFRDERTIDRGIPSFQGRPSNANIETFFGDPDLSNGTTSIHAGDLTIERGLGSSFTLRNRSHVVDYDKFYQNVFPGAVNAAGTEVSLSAYNNRHDRRNIFNQTDLTYAVRTGAVKQTWMVGAELGSQRTDNFRNTGFFDDQVTSISVPFAQPTVARPVTFRQSATDADNRVTSDVAAIYMQSQLELGEHVQALAGLRYDWFDLTFRNHRSDQELTRKDRMISPRLGLVYKPLEAMSVYGSYSVSHLPSSGDQFSSLTATTKTLEPERFINRELGVKWDVRPDLAFTAAVYRLDRSNTSAPDPLDATKVVQTGRQRTTGIEADVTGNLTSNWQITGGYASQTAKIVSRTSAAPEGARVPLVPRHMFSLWNRYQVTQRFGAGLGVVHAADMFAAIDNTVTLPSFTRVDAAVYATLHQHLRAQLNIENVFDRRYFATSHGNNNIMPGAPRTLRVSVTASR